MGQSRRHRSAKPDRLAVCIERLAREQKGDTVYVTESSNGGITLTPYDPALEEQLELGREFMREYRDTFRQLAK